MSGDAPGPRQDLAGSSITIPSDSENYSSGNHNDLSPSPPSSSTSPMILYTPPTIWGLLRGAAINLLLPFVNGLMLGFGELFAHEAAFRLGWSGTKYASSRPALFFTRQHPELLSTDRSIWRSPPCTLQLNSRLEAVRYASTASNVSTAAAATEPAALHTEEFIPPSIEDITSSLPLIPERIGYLKEIGLDYGWGPTAFVEYLLEHVHVYSTTPWWASIILTALIVRVALLKGYIGAADVSARSATITDLQKPIKARLDAAKAAQDSAAMVQATQDLRALYRQAGIQLWKLAVPLIQVPIGYGTFRLLKGMAALPVPGLEDGGLLWIKDLTISDPYMILPATTAIAIYYTFKAGGELGSTSMNPGIYKFALYVMPVLGGGFMLLYPACLQLTFGFTALLSLTQSYLLRQPWMRKFLGIYPLPKPKNNLSVPAIQLQKYLPPSQTPPVIEVNNGISDKAKKKVSEFAGAASEFKKSLTRMARPTTAATTKPLPTSTQAAKAQQLQQKRLRELAQAQLEAEKEKHEPASGRRKMKGERR